MYIIECIGSISLEGRPNYLLLKTQIALATPTAKNQQEGLVSNSLRRSWVWMKPRTAKASPTTTPILTKAIYFGSCCGL